MKTTLTPTPKADPRSFADRLDDIRSHQQSVATATRALLVRQGWRRTRMNPAQVWLWSRKFPDGRTILTDLNTALTIECSFTHQPPLGPLAGPVSQTSNAPGKSN